MSFTNVIPPESSLYRYKGLVDDWGAFTEALGAPLPASLRVQTGKISPADLGARLARQGIVSHPWEWDPEILVTSHESVGATIEHWLGLYYVQELTQTIPVRVLEPQPDEWILDLCAAPGGKTTQIAAQMGNRGVLVVNEPAGRRQPALLANLTRLEVANAVVLSRRGEEFPLGRTFDRVLVDAPCSGEGTLRKDSSMRFGASPRLIARMSKLQKLLIVRGFDLLRSGGRLVYSTCTFAPEENEAVIAELLERREHATVERITLAWPHAAGTCRWNGASYPESVGDTIRVYPHHLNSGGGFVASIRRTIAA
ncbi:RsmB/NOP family class I SAM-dependent RNA methyltransferase [Candidatus Bipolaricaulota bacterium]|nr:RsmB/NOP family class I SAM-dependent RNA methyltransferase [Candidatus Bipolaricaulota bacterium]